MHTLLCCHLSHRCGRAPPAVAAAVAAAAAAAAAACRAAAAALAVCYAAETDPVYGGPAKAGSRASGTVIGLVLSMSHVLQSAAP